MAPRPRFLEPMTPPALVFPPGGGRAIAAPVPRMADPAAIAGNAAA
ncbi:MAG: hypothetical protein JO329_02800 [Planctomycetaceae bacterium]|nr:hypothetical protein [Planctomycetaceae bacterium]